MVILHEALKKFEEKDYNSAGKILFSLYQDNPSDELVIYHLARVYDQKGIYGKAETLLNTIYNNNNSVNTAVYHSATFLLGKIYEKWDDKSGHLQMALGFLSKIPKNARNYHIASKYIDNIQKQVEHISKIQDYESQPTEYFSAHELTDLGFLVRDIDNLEVCSQKDEYYFRIAQIYSNIKNAKFKKAKEDGVKFSELNQIKEFDTLDKVVNTYLQKVGFDI